MTDSYLLRTGDPSTRRGGCPTALSEIGEPFDCPWILLGVSKISIPLMLLNPLYFTTCVLFDRCPAKTMLERLITFSDMAFY